MATSIRDNLELVLAGYEEARKTETFGGKHELWDVFDTLKQEFAGSPSVKSRPTLRVVWSAGKGNWANVPWISFLDERETNTTRRGVYCVYLFRQDMSGVYLAFQQGVTDAKEQHGRIEGLRLLKAKATELRSICGDLVRQGFRLNDEIALRAGSGVGSDYGSSTVAYKFYEAEAIPDDETLLEDLEAVLRTYDRYLVDEKWAGAITLCSSLLRDRAAFEAEEIDYKLKIVERIREALDPGLPPGEFSLSLRRAFANSHNNLTNWQAHDRFTKWAANDPHNAQVAVSALLEDEPVERRIDDFLTWVPDSAVSGLGTRVSMASFLLMGIDPATYPMYKPTPFGKVERLLGWPRVPEDRSPGGVYAHHRAFAQRFLEELRSAGLDVRNLLDAQSLIWILASSEEPAVALWRGEEVDPQPALDELLRWLRSLRTQRSPDGRFHYKPLLLTAMLDILDREPGHANLFGYEELRDEFMRLVAEAGSEATEEQFSQPYLRMSNDVEPSQVWVLQPSTPEDKDDGKADRPSYVRAFAPSVCVSPAVWPTFVVPEARALVRREILARWPVGEGPAEGGSWFDPLHDAPIVEAELQRLLKESGRSHQELLAAVFRRAVYLHQKAGTEGYLGSQPTNPKVCSISIGHLYSCFVARRNRMSLLVDNDLRIKEKYPDAASNKSTRGELLWISEGLDPAALRKVLEDETVWSAYEVMLSKIGTFPIAHSNQDNRGKLSVLTGERLGEVRSLGELADQLLLDEGFLERVIELLRDKGQAIFYGPPGTGKTYVARKIMEYLASDSGRREVVQFHPSYSYEDFVQGYRPITRKDGALAYELKAGPLMRLASEAAESPGEHVLLIDEINRGNLPKILGELLYLLEYRDDEVALMYGEDGTRFFLPENLLIVGTMNTADRSIALIDAALRRRFYFVPFFPDTPPLKGLLRRWLQRHRPEMMEVADIVDRLNEQLRGLFGPHLQVGPSYFMKENLDEGMLQRAWDYDVMPFLEDQLYGQEEELERFKLHRLRGAESANDRAEGAPTDSGSPDEG